MTDDKPTVRKGQYTGQLERETFRARFMRRFYDPAFQAEQAALARLEAIAWDAYAQGRKAPITVKAGPGHADPDYDLSVEWKETRDRLALAERAQQDPATPSRVLVIIGASRNDGTCPGEVSKSWRLARILLEELQAAGMRTDTLDLSRLVSEYEYRIHPCKGCVSTAMPLCHWPCSCYPNHSLGQDNDAMGAIYEQWVAAHGVILVAPSYWYQSPSPLKLMIDRLVCAYGLVVHGDVAGIEAQRRALSDWLDWMGLVDAGASSRLDRYIGYYRPYATSHEELDRDRAVQQEVRNVARAVANFIPRLRRGAMAGLERGIRDPRPK
ncbi:flavodoxin family protein [Achromobacter xylosoxidans]